MIFVLKILIVIATFFFMEFMAWFTHKYVMHGVLWKLHEDHHTHTNTGFFENNDAFFLIFAVPSMLLIFSGVILDAFIPLYIGIGVAVYGAAYFMVHDIFIHQRFRLFQRTDNPYFRALRKAHKVHHKHLGKEHGECFGMLVVPWSYFRNEFRRKRNNSGTASQ